MYKRVQCGPLGKVYPVQTNTILNYCTLNEIRNILFLLLSLYFSLSITGLGDTKTPLKYSLIFTSLNAILDPLFIFTLKFGASGAAAGTALAQYIALVPLMLALNKKVKVDIFGQLSQLKKSLKEYIASGSLVLVRTLGKVLAYSVCAREAVSLIVLLQIKYY